MKITIIYNRVSTQEQNPENQVKDCKALAKKLELDSYDILQEKKSGWKEVDREIFDRIVNAIKKRQVTTLIVWDLDRLYRNRKKLIAFFQICKMFKCKVYSFRQQWMQSLNNIQTPFDEIVHDLMLQVMGWLAEDDSKKKSERTKAAIRVDIKGVTRSYLGRKWGRKSISKRVINEVLNLRKQNKTIREIAAEVHYWDEGRNKKQISKSAVHNIIQTLSKGTS